jgi:hypothetical protein
LARTPWWVRHHEAAGFGQRGVGVLACDGKQGFLRGNSPAVHQIEDHTLVLPDDSGVRLAGKIANRGGMPVVAPRKAGGVVHSLLHNGPFAGGRHDEGVEIELEAVADSIVVDLRGEAAAADERVAGDSRAVGNGT